MSAPTPARDRDTYMPGSGLIGTSINVIDSQERAHTKQVAAKGYDTMTGVGTPNGAAAARRALGGPPVVSAALYR